MIGRRVNGAKSYLSSHPQEETVCELWPKGQEPASHTGSEEYTSLRDSPKGHLCHCQF